MEDPNHRDDGEYLLGTDAAELRRLGFQHQAWLAELAHGFTAAGFGPGDRIADLGCGPGFTTLALAELVGETGEVLAVDRSATYLDHLAHRARALGLARVHTSRQEADALELDDASLDGALARWLLCYLERPEVVVDAVARALVPGGRFLVQDYGRYDGFAVYPAHPVHPRVVAAVQESWRLAGGELGVAERVPAMMVAAGLEIVSIRPIVRVARPGDALWHWIETFYHGYLPRLVGWGLLTDEDAADFEQHLARCVHLPDAYLLTPPMLETIGRRP